MTLDNAPFIDDRKNKNSPAVKIPWGIFYYSQPQGEILTWHYDFDPRILLSLFAPTPLGGLFECSMGEIRPGSLRGPWCWALSSRRIRAEFPEEVAMAVGIGVRLDTQSDHCTV
jgi:hypothetical protein